MARISFQTEKDLEDVVYKMLSNGDDRLCSIIPPYKHVLRQLNMDSYGIADLVTFTGCLDSDGDIEFVTATIIELKNTEIKKEALFQALRYKTFLLKHINIVDEVSIVLIGSSIDKSSEIVFSENLGDITLITFGLNEDGISFKHEHGYVINTVSEKIIDNVDSLIRERLKNVEKAS